VFTFRTDRGYEVALEEAQVGVASLELVPCKLTEAAPAAGGMGRALAWLSPAEAWANHGYVHDPSLVGTPAVDSPFLPGPRPFGTAQAPGRAYCRLHELLAPLDAASDGLRLDRASAQVRGSFTSPGGETRRFEGRVGLRGGALVDLPGGPRVAGGSPLTVTVVRAPARAFDGVALDALSPSETAYAFLRGLAKGTRAEVEGGLPSGSRGPREVREGRGDGGG
ncbi:MAG TPA: hypothetical protein VGI39_00075, partial [Polyangiaceae bacterium]